MSTAGRHRETVPPLRPAWDGIWGWICMILALLVAAVAWDAVVNGLDIVVLVLTGVGLSLLARRALR